MKCVIKKKKIDNPIVLLGFLLWKIQVAFPGENQLQQSRTAQPMVHAGFVSVSIIHQTLAWTKGLWCMLGLLVFP